MAVTDLAGAIGDSLLKGNNNPGLVSPIFSYPGSYQGTFYGGGTTPPPGYPKTGAPAAPTAAPGPTAEQIAAQQQAAKNAAAAKAIDAGFGGVIQNYDQQLADIPGQIDSAGQIVNSQYGAQRGSLDSSYGRGQANLNYARDTLNTNTQRSIADLAKSIRQSFDSYSTLIGAKGAGDSSATGQLSYALQKVNADNRSDIYQSQNDQLGAIGLKQGDLDAQYQDQIKTLDAWKSQQIIQIGQQFKAAQQQIEAAKAGANKDKLLALASLSGDLVNNAIAALSGVAAQHQNTVAGINQSLQKLSAPGNAPALASVNYTPTAAATPQAPGISFNGGSPAAGGDSFAAVPYYKRLTAQGA